MIDIGGGLFLRDDEIEVSFIRAGGPGGQNVNKVSSAVQLRFDARRSSSLTPAISARLQTIAGAKLTKDGVIVITANRFRTQEANRRDALDRLAEMIREAAIEPKFRIPTRPTRASKTRRLEGKARKAGLKKLRRVRPNDD